MRFKIDWASLIVGSKFSVSALSYFVFGGNSKYKPSPPLRGGDIWRGLFFSEFYGILLDYPITYQK